MKTAMITADENGIPQETLAAIRNGGIEITCRKCLTEAELIEFAADADVLWMFGPNPALTAGALDHLPKCKALFRSGSGVDALPLKRAAELGIEVHNTPESIAESVAEHAVSLLFAMAHTIVEGDRNVRRGKWFDGLNYMRWHLTGRTLGLVGYGRIARHVETMVSGFRMSVIHFDPFSKDSVPLDELLANSDFVSLHCPLTENTRHMIGMRELKLMKRNAVLVNTSRGAVVNEKALIEALKNGIIGGAALDVTDPEPPEKDNPLLTMDNVTITSHIAAFSADFEKNFWQCSVEKLKTLSGKFK